MKTEVIGSDIVVSGVPCLDVELCLFCGQAFRWRKNSDGSFHGIVGRRITDVSQKDNTLIFRNTTLEDFNSLWKDYFDLEADYEKYCSALKKDKYAKMACEEYYGIRILHQQPWEALCSFIISQNNNIPRITAIIDRLCRGLGEKLCEESYSFPGYEDIAKLTPEDLSFLRAGFRGKYIIDAAQKLSSGEISIDKIYEMPYEKAKAELMKIKGVGPKVADCTLLYGFFKTESFPTDVWVKKILSEMYPEGIPDTFRGIEGIAQQYLFHWRRNSPRFTQKEKSI